MHLDDASLALEAVVGDQLHEMHVHYQDIDPAKSLQSCIYPCDGAGVFHHRYATTIRARQVITDLVSLLDIEFLILSEFLCIAVFTLAKPKCFSNN